ncbi:DUF4350 domain-containing protein [Pseudomonas sp. LJDD11]|uniref:DUF4350 domain-containing protein n=1 Tax=unclassified Pseudomonas TaxID=196821 RepID=UPI0004F5E24C|nr:MULTISPECIES: DUF4350 domain-containing protein [unclassified Pseudomonas]MCQ9422455.1 DUF4350 domain-containing protein [Pseudomonas sp. LJDD11]BAP43636.1 hypothetical protein PSCI_2934 [Pseudomonas sp. StFLB209]
MKRGYLLPGLLVSVVLAVVIVLFIRQLEPYEETIDRGPSPEARTNPYLAAEQFLLQRSITVRSADTWTELPEPTTQRQTLLILDDRSRMTPEQVDPLLAWADAGGHLVVVAEQLWDEQQQRSGDLLLDRLQIRQSLTRDLPKTQAEDSGSAPAVPMARPTPAKTPWPHLTRLYLENEDAPAYMSFDPAYHLEDPQDLAAYWANSANATHMLQLEHGAGLVTVLTDSQLWTNHSIGEYDNAWLLWYLTQDSSVTLIAQARHDTLLSLLLRHFPLAIVTLALLLALAVWRVAMREGPLQWPAPAGRRQLVEHLRASADFLLRHRGQQALLKNLQQDILRRARQRHPGFETLVVTEQWQVLARLSRQSTSAISLAMRPRPAQRLSSADFTRQVAHLQTLRNAL